MIESLIFDAILFIYKVLISVSAGRIKRDNSLACNSQSLTVGTRLNRFLQVYLKVMLLMLLWLLFMLPFGF